MQKFKIDINYLTDVMITEQYNEIAVKDTLTTQDTFDIINGLGNITVTRHEDHPKFTQLRDKLSKLGYINKVTNYVNGDTVLKPFTLNYRVLNTGERFMSASAMKYSLMRPNI